MDKAQILPPSKRELGKLGHQALGVYIARAALRASIFLCAKSPLASIWPKDTLRHSVGLLGVWVLLRHAWSSADAPYIKKNANLFTITDDANSAQFAIQVAAKISQTALQAATRSAKAAIAATVAATDTIYASSEAIHAARDDILAINGAIIEDPIIAATAIISAIEDPIIAAAYSHNARVDYDFLLLQQASLEGKDTFHPPYPLWKGIEANYITDLQQHYLRSLRDLGLDFLQDDVFYAWGLNGENTPSQKYLQTFEQRLHCFEQLWQLSETEHLDVAALKRILGEDARALISLNAARIVLVGPGGAGKTALNRLLHTDQPLSQSSSASLAIEHKRLTGKKHWQSLLSQKEKQAVSQLKLSTWDFAGQTLFYGLHQAFLHENCVYVLVVDNRHEQAPDAWLAQIDYVLRGKGAEGRSVPVLIVTNEYEGLTTKQNQNRLMREYPHLLSEDSFFYFSCLETSGHDYPHFIKTLLKECLNSQHNVFAGTLQAVEGIKDLFKKGTVELKSGELHCILQEILAEKDKPAVGFDHIEKLKNTLEGLGVIVPIGTQSVIDPNKVVSASYQLLCNNRLKQEMAERNGSVSTIWLQDLLSQNDADSADKAIELETLIGFLSKRGICFEEKDNYVFPDALTEQEHPDVASVYKKPDTEDNRSQLRIHYDLDFLPFGLNGQLIQAAFKQCSQKWLNTEYLWRDGLMLQNGSAQAVLQLNKHKTRIDLTLRGDSKDDNTFLEFKSLLGKINTLVCTVIGESQRVTPFIEIDEQLITLSSENLNMLLNNVDQFESLMARIKEMSKGNTTFISGNIGQATTGDNSPNIQTNITFTHEQGQDWEQILEAFSKTQSGQNLSDAQKEQLKSLKETQQLPDSKKSIIKKILEGASTTLGTAADLATITGFYTLNAVWITPLILSMLGQN